MVRGYRSPYSPKHISFHDGGPKLKLTLLLWLLLRFDTSYCLVNYEGQLAAYDRFVRHSALAATPVLFTFSSFTTSVA
jgi:hypothetical protein